MRRYSAVVDQVRLAELCMATSLFTDLGTGQPAEHGLRTCRAAMRLAEGLGATPMLVAKCSMSRC